VSSDPLAGFSGGVWPLETRREGKGKKGKWDRERKGEGEDEIF